MDDDQEKWSKVMNKFLLVVLFIAAGIATYVAGFRDGWKVGWTDNDLCSSVLVDVFFLRVVNANERLDRFDHALRVTHEIFVRVLCV